MTKGEIRIELEKIAKDNNYTLTNNVDRIINAKLRFLVKRIGETALVFKTQNMLV